MGVITYLQGYFNPRMSGQREVILDRLRRGSATNQELAKIGLRYSARIHELRGQGHQIETKALKGGLTQYRLVLEKTEQGAA